MCSLPTGNHFLPSTPWCSCAQVKKCLLYDCEDRSFHKNAGGKIACNVSTGKAETTLPEQAG